MADGIIPDIRFSVSRVSNEHEEAGQEPTREFVRSVEVLELTAQQKVFDVEIDQIPSLRRGARRG